MIQDEYTDSQSLISSREEIDHAYLHEHGIEHCHEHSHSHEHMHDHMHEHGHVHSPEEKKAVINRLSKAIGHLEAVKRMVEKDADCSDVLINNTGKVVLKNHLNHCIVEAVEENDMEAIERLNQAIDKFMK